MNRLTDQEMKDKMNLNIRDHMEANGIKDRLERKGYRFTISLYGVIRDRITNIKQYRRIEVFMKKSPDQFDVQGIRSFFDEVKPKHYYSVWVYNVELKKIVLMKSWE